MFFYIIIIELFGHKCRVVSTWATTMSMQSEFWMQGPLSQVCASCDRMAHNSVLYTRPPTYSVWKVMGPNTYIFFGINFELLIFLNVLYSIFGLPLKFCFLGHLISLSYFFVEKLRFFAFCGSILSFFLIFKKKYYFLATLKN